MQDFKLLVSGGVLVSTLSTLVYITNLSKLHVVHALQLEELAMPFALAHYMLAKQLGHIPDHLHNLWMLAN